jgi:hypothetical protein
MCAADLAAAMAQETITDESGRRVRLKHAFRTRVNGIQGSFWGDIRTMTHPEMELNKGQRRRGVTAELIQINNDIRFFNLLHPDWPQITLALDFTRDIREAEQDHQSGDQAA